MHRQAFKQWWLPCISLQGLRISYTGYITEPDHDIYHSKERGQTSDERKIHSCLNWLTKRTDVKVNLSGRDVAFSGY